MRDTWFQTILDQSVSTRDYDIECSSSRIRGQPHANTPLFEKHQPSGSTWNIKLHPILEQWLDIFSENIFRNTQNQRKLRILQLIGQCCVLTLTIRLACGMRITRSSLFSPYSLVSDVSEVTYLCFFVAPYLLHNIPRPSLQ